MRRLVCMVIVLSTLFNTVSCCASCADLSQYSDTELSALKKQVLSEIDKREKEKEKENIEARKSKGIDFLASLDIVKQMWELNAIYDYENMIALINNYLNGAEDVGRNDSAMIILELANEGFELSKECLVEYDRFDMVAKVWHRELTELSRENNVLPYIYDDEFYCKIGFFSDDWLFFNRAVIASDNTDSFEVFDDHSDTKTLDCGEIVEFCDVSYGIDQLAELDNNKNPVLRFINDTTDEHIDHTINASEIVAIHTLNRLTVILREIRGILQEWW